MSQILCPHCGRPITESTGPLTTQVFPEPVSEGMALAQAQLMEYARDLARVYAVQKRMAKYLPGGLRERIRVGEGGSLTGGQRRYVTVLFADLADFTLISSRLDPEDIFDLLNTCFRQLVAHIYKYGGEVDKFLGDGIMAVFGAPEAHEDDPVRAVQAALDMDVEMRELSRRLRPRLGETLQLHIGISCGEVIAGNVGVDEQQSYTVVGKTVNLAFRLQEVAEPGMILVSQSVQQATQHLFRYRYYRDLEIKGFQGKVPVFILENRLQQRTAPEPYFEEHFPWTGRQREMEQLRQLMERLTLGEGSVVLVEGEPGTGKTRLVREWLARHTPPAVKVWTSTAHMVQSRTGYSVWRNLSQWSTSVSGDPVESRGAAPTSARSIPLPSTLLTLALSQLEQLTTKGEAEETRLQIFQAIRQVLITQIETTPLVLAIDNWQWADDLSRHLLLSLLPLADQHPILFCILSRPVTGQEHDISREVKFRAIQNYHHIRLAPLTDKEVEQLITSIFAEGELDQTALSVILGWTQGNPYFLREIMSSLATQKIIERVGKWWKLREAYPFSSLRFPPNLLDMTTANLDRLPEELREVLYCAAVIGSTFPLSLLRRVLARQNKSANLDNRIQELKRYGLLEVSTQDPNMLVFRYPIVHESVYTRLSSYQRQMLHEVIAEEMEKALEEEPTANVELVAEHFIQAGLPARSLRYLMQAGQRALRQAASKLAIEHYTAALMAVEYSPRYHEERLEIEIGLADAYLQAQEYAEAISHYQSALELCNDLGKRITLRQAIAHAYLARNDLPKAWESLEAALEELSEGEVPATSPLRGRVFADCAQIEWRMGNRQRAELWAREAAAILEGTPEHVSLAASYQTLGQVYAMLGQTELASSYQKRATAHLRTTTAFLRSLSAKIK